MKKLFSKILVTLIILSLLGVFMFCAPPEEEKEKKEYPLTVHGYTFADNITEYTGEENKKFGKKLALNGVRGKGDSAGSLDVFVIGEGTDKYATFEWKGKAIINGDGHDFKVFENGFLTKKEGKTVMAMDLGTVEVSIDGTNWLKFPVTYNDKPYVNSLDGKSGFVGLKTVHLNFDDEKLIDPYSDEAGGDGFDLSDFGIPEGGTIKYVRVRDGGEDYPDGQKFSNGIDIDGVCAFYWKKVAE